MSDISLLQNDDLNARLEQLSRKLRFLAVARGAGTMLTLIVAMCAIFMALDYLVQLNETTRTVLLLCGGCFYLVAFVQLIIRPLLTKASPVELAAVVESQHPELDERLSSAIQLSAVDQLNDQNGSTLMRTWLFEQAEFSTSNIDFSETISLRPARTWVISGCVAILVILQPFLISPANYSLLWARMLVPWGQFAEPGQWDISITNGNRVVARGSDVVIEATIFSKNDEQQQPETVQLHWMSGPAAGESRYLDYDADAGTYVTTLSQVIDDFQYRLMAETQRSAVYEIEVTERPRLTGLHLDVQPPSYTGLPAESYDGAIGNITVWEGSQLSFRADFNKAVSDAMLLGLNDKIQENTAEASNSNDPIPLEINKDGTSGSVQFVAKQGGPYSFVIHDTHGLTGKSSSQRMLTIRRDEPPQLFLTDYTEPRTVNDHETVPVVVSATDDIGLGAMELHVVIEDDTNPLNPTETSHVDTIPVSLLGKTNIDYEFQIRLADFDLVNGDLVRYQIRIADECALPEPHEVWSDWQMLIIDESASPLSNEEILKRQAELNRKLNELQEELRQHHDDLAELEKIPPVKPDQKDQPNRDQQLQNHSKKGRDIANSLEKLADEFDRLPLYDELRDPTNQIAREQLAQSSQQLQQASGKSDSKQAETVNKALENVDQAKQDLAKVADRFSQLAEIERDLLDLNRLAQAAKKLARDAQSLSVRSRAESSTQPENQEQITEQRQELKQEQLQISKDLDDLLDRRPELIAAMKKRLRRRLIEASEHLSAIAVPERLLAETLSKPNQQTNDNQTPADVQNEADLRKSDLATKQTLQRQQAKQFRLIQETAQKTLELAHYMNGNSKLIQEAMKFTEHATAVQQHALIGDFSRAEEAARRAVRAAENTLAQAKASSGDGPSMLNRQRHSGTC